MATINAKVFEPYFNNHLSRLIYAVFEDIKTKWNGPLIYSDLMFQNYKNLLLEKKLQAEKLGNRFTVSTEVRQMLTKLFAKMIEELNLIDINEGDDIQTISQKLDNEITECYTTFMWKTASEYKCKFGDTLKNDVDKSLWLQNHIVGLLPKYVGKAMIIAIISTEFEAFLKAVAWILGQMIWYYEVSVSSGLFLGTLAQLSMQQIMIDELSSCVRPKPPAKPKAKKASASATPSSSEPTTATPPANAENAEQLEQKPEETIVMPTEALDEDLADVLASV